MDTLLQDVRYGWRALWRTPGFTIVAALTLALGVGANTAIFSIVDAVLLRALPYTSADRLVKVGVDNPGLSLRDVRFSAPELDDMRSRPGVFDELSVVWPISVNLTGAKQPERLELLAVSPNYFSMLGVTAQIGRLFDATDVVPGFSESAIISDALWRRSYGADPHVLGRQVRLDNDLYTIVGVTPASFRHPGKTVAHDVDVWGAAGFRGLPFSPARSARSMPAAIGRVKQGMSLAQAQERLDSMAASLRAEFPNDYPAAARWSVTLQPLQTALIGPVRSMLIAILGAVVLIILIASVNVASLQLARASARRREVGTRLALGASRSRLVRQMLVEAVLLSGLASAAGVAGAAAALGALVQFVPASIPRLTEVRLDTTVLLFALGLAVASALLFGLAPALHMVRQDLVSAIRDGGSGSGQNRGTSRLRQVLIASEFALAVVLLVGAGLLLRTFWGLVRESPGFNPSHVVSASIWLPVPNDPSTDVYATPAARSAFVRDTLDRVRAMPGVEMAAVTSDLPISDPTVSIPINIDGRVVEGSQALTAFQIRISPGYFETLQVPIVSGRLFTEHDDEKSDPVAIVDHTMAARYWPGADPAGQRLRLGPRLVTIVGVVEDVKHNGLDADGQPHVYFPILQRGTRTMSYVLRTSLPAAALEPQIRQAVQRVDPGLPVFNVRTMDEVIAVSLAPRRFSAQLVGVFAVLALLVAAVGIYGLLAHMVGQRTREIGLRMALGAKPADVVRLVATSGVGVAAAGIAIGLATAALVAPLATTLLYGVRAIDPAVRPAPARRRGRPSPTACRGRSRGRWARSRTPRPCPRRDP